MEIKLKRTSLNSHSTLGDLSVNDTFECHTLEDIVRKPGVKVFGATAIPTGIFVIIVNLSARFKRFMPRLLEVPSFDGILIHSGNTDVDTHGCILVGDKLTSDGRIQGGTSKVAYDRLFLKIEQAIKLGEKVTIEITDEFPEEVQ
jgi:hypothetical protein